MDDLKQLECLPCRLVYKLAGSLCMSSCSWETDSPKLLTCLHLPYWNEPFQDTLAYPYRECNNLTH